MSAPSQNPDVLHQVALQWRGIAQQRGLVQQQGSSGSNRGVRVRDSSSSRTASTPPACDAPTAVPFPVSACGVSLAYLGALADSVEELRAEFGGPLVDGMSTASFMQSLLVPALCGKQAPKGR